MNDDTGRTLPEGLRPETLAVRTALPRSPHSSPTSTLLRS